MDDPPSVEAHYDALADVYAETTETPMRERATWPTTRSLLPALDGARALDAGCGPGVYTAWMAEQGADAVGVDVSAEMVEHARDAHGEAAAFERGDLTEPLDFPDDSFDVVLCQLALSHVPELAPPLREFARVLADGGVLAVTSHHPLHDFLVVRDREYPDVDAEWEMDLDPVVEAENHPPNYYETEKYRIEWGGDGFPATYYRRPLSTFVNALLDAGFSLDELREPLPDDAFAEAHPDAYERLLRRPPELFCLRASV